MKIYINKASENWVVDRFREEWYSDNQHISSESFFRANLIWIISPWTFNNFYFKLFPNKKYVYSVFHIEDSVRENNYMEIKKIDKFVSCYHTISLKTKSELSKITNKKIYYIPFWIDPKIWFEIENKEKLYEKYNLDKKKFLVGSFQRDSLAVDSFLPKLIKGPDIFLKNVIDLKQKINKNICIVLTGRKRDYLINELKNNNIEYKYFEMAKQSELNELYNCLDLYIVSSRLEGGPQAIVECGITNTPIVSTNVGMVEDFLHKDAIYDSHNFLNAKPNNEFLMKNVRKLIIPEGFKKFFEMFESI